MDILWILIYIILAFIILRLIMNWIQPRENQMIKKLLDKLSTCNLKEAAFHIVKKFEKNGGIFKKEVALALELFTKLPCPETALLLITACPEIAAIMTSGESFFLKQPNDCRGPALQDYEKWTKNFELNLQIASAIHMFLSKETINGSVKVGFHRLRDQSPLFWRLNQIGISKMGFIDSRQFLRDTISKNQSAFNVVIDMICIHGIHEGKEKFWNALGAESDGQIHLQSEIMFEITPVIDSFIAILNKTRQTVDSSNDFEN